ncbi:MAG: hypothetical protein V3V74_07245 [Nitrosomonadaceae bacterium]
MNPIEYCTCHNPKLYFQTFPSNFHKINIEAIDERTYDYEFEDTYAVICRNCDALGGIGFSKEEALEIWKKRYPKPYKPEDAPKLLQEIIDIFDSGESD